jgi:hypothetical protein
LEENQQSREKRIIIDDLASYEQEIGVSRGIRRRGRFGEFDKSVVVFFLLIGIVVGSFWVSFLLGKKVLLPVKPLVTKELTPIEEQVPAKTEPVAAEEGIPPAVTIVEEEVLEAPAKIVKPSTVPLEQIKYYKVQAGLFKSKADAQALADKLKASGFSPFIRKLKDGSFRAQVGAFRAKSQAQSLVNQLSLKHYDSIVIYE